MGLNVSRKKANKFRRHAKRLTNFIVRSLGRNLPLAVKAITLLRQLFKNV